MKNLKIILVGVLSGMLSTSCGQPNLLSDFAQTDSDQALYIEAKKKIDDMAWDDAISIIENRLSASFQAQANVKETLAGAYVGKCGLTFFELVDGLSNASPTRIFEYFMGVFKNMTLTPDACEEAIAIIESIGGVSERTQDQNLFLAILGVARIGVTLSYKLDQEDHDGVADSTFNVCHEYADQDSDGDIDKDDILTRWPDPIYDKLIQKPVPAPEHYLTDDDVKKVVTGFGLIMENLASLSEAIGETSDTMGSLEGIKAECENAVGGACDITDPTAVTAQIAYAFRLLLDATDWGFGSCDLATPLPTFTGMEPDNSVDMTGICCATRVPEGFSWP